MNKHLRLELGRNKARKVIRAWNGYWTHLEWLSEDGRVFKRLVHTRTPCSCAGCGNPRKHFGERSRQEILSDLDFSDQVKDLTTV